MKTLIVGAGAVGGYFGGRLLHAGRDVTFLVRPHRAAELAKNGLRIRSPHGDLHLPSPSTITADQLTKPFDLVIVSSKAQDLLSAIEDFAPAVGPQTAVLPLLNGMRHMDVLNARFGKARVLGGQCVISVTRDSEGGILQLTEMQFLSFGEQDGSRTERAQAILAFLVNGGFDVAMSDNILLEMWSKWVFIATGAGITCLMRAAVGDIVEAGATDLVVNLLEEGRAIAAAEEFPIADDAISRARAMFTQPRSTLTASMLRDIENHAPTEGDYILGDLLNEHAHMT
jgi:2-dehydropantoate 2-reductase